MTYDFFFKFIILLIQCKNNQFIVIWYNKGLGKNLNYIFLTPFFNWSLKSRVKFHCSVEQNDQIENIEVTQSHKFD